MEPEQRTLAEVLHRFMIRLVENHEVFIKDKRERQVALHRLVEMLNERESQVVQTLRGITDYQEAFTTFCWTLRHTVGECVVNPFKIGDEQFSLVINTDHAKVTLLLDQLKDVRVLPDNLWIAVKPEGQIMAPVLRYDLNGLGEKFHTLIGMIFKNDRGNYNFVYNQKEVWRDVDGAVVSAITLMRILCSSVVFLYYQRYINDKSSSHIRLRFSRTPIQISDNDHDFIRNFFAGALPGRHRRNNLNIVQEVAKRKTFVNHVPNLTVAQRAAVKMLNIPEASGREFEICQSQYDMFLRTITERYESRLNLKVYLESERTNERTQIAVQDGKLKNINISKFMCPRCLKDAEEISVSGRQYCVKHYPAKTVKYTVFFTVPRFGVGPSKVCCNVSPNDGTPNLSIVLNADERYRYHELTPDVNHIYVVSTLEEANLIHHILVLGSWLKDAKTHSTNKQRLWLSTAKAGNITPDPVRANEILEKFGIRWTTNSAGGKNEWSLPDALKYNFMFEDHYKFHAIYMLESDNPVDSNVIYIGKNSDSKNAIADYGRASDRFVKSSILVSSPNKELSQYLESTLQATFLLGSMLGLERNSKLFTVSNYYIEPIDRNAPHSFEEYLNICSQKFLGISVSID